MGVKPVIFDSNGRISQHVRPGAYSESSYIDSSSGISSIANGVILGESIGGEPNQIYSFATEREAVETLIKGNLLDAVRCCFNPNSTYKPQRVFAMPINKKTRASCTISEKGKDIFKVVASQYGIEGNRLSVSFIGSEENKKVLLKLAGKTLLEKSYRKELFKILLPSTSTIDCEEFTITKDHIIFKGEKIDLYQNSLIGDVVDSLKGIGLEVELASPEFRLESSSIIDCLEGGYIDKSTPCTVTADLSNALEILNKSGYVKVEKLVDYQNSLSTEINDLVFSGGANGTCTALDFLDALEVLERKDIQFITTPSTDLSVALLLKDHCERMNSREGKAERQFIVGHEWGLGIDGVIERALLLGTKYGALVSPGFKSFDPEDLSYSQLREYHAGYTAAKEMGLIMAMSVNEPATYKKIDCIGVETVYTSSEIDRLIKAGVWAVEYTKNIEARNVRSVTTNRGENLMECEFSVMRECLWMTRDLREAIDSSLIGRAGREGMKAIIMSIMLSKLEYYKNVVNTLVDYKKDSIVIDIDGDTYRTEFVGSPTLPINFVFNSNQFTIFKSEGKIG